MTKRGRWQERAADLAGRLLRGAGTTLPGVAGAVLVCVGLGLAWLPLGVVASGVALLAVDWRLAGARTPKPAQTDDSPHYVRLRSVS